MRKSIYKMVPLIVLFALLFCGCGESENSGGSVCRSSKSKGCSTKFIKKLII